MSCAKCLTLTAVAWVVAASVSSSAPVASQTGEPTRRTVFVVVRDRTGGFVTDLAARDFVVREDGKALTVVGVDPMTAPMSVAVVVDGTLTESRVVQSAVATFVRRMRDRAEVGLFAIGAGKVLDYTTNAEALVAAVKKVRAPLQGPRMVHSDDPASAIRAVLTVGRATDGVFEAARDSSHRTAARRAIVIVMLGAGELGPDTQTLDALRKSGAVLYAVVFVGVDGTLGIEKPTSEAISDPTLAEGARRSGGRRQDAIVLPDISRILDEVANDLAHQFAVTYTLPEGVQPSERVSVSLARPNAILLAPTRVPDR